MKITLTSAEVKEVVRSFYKLDANDVVEITDVPHSFDILFDREYEKVQGFINGRNLIAAIKELRTKDNIGLWEAKTIVENWTEFRTQSIGLGRSAIVRRVSGLSDGKVQFI